MTSTDHKMHIENSDRGITLNKSLAWSIVVALVGGGFWVGVQLTGLNAAIVNLGSERGSERVVTDQYRSQVNGDLRALGERTRSIENNAARDDARLLEILRLVTDLKDSVNAIDQQIRNNP